MGGTGSLLHLDPSPLGPTATEFEALQLVADVTGLTSYAATIGETTQFTLVAEGQRPGNVDNVASASVVAQAPPVINGFTATSSGIYVGDFGVGYPTTPRSAAA
jgi:hypothetical protein